MYEVYKGHFGAQMLVKNKDRVLTLKNASYANDITLHKNVLWEKPFKGCLHLSWWDVLNKKMSQNMHVKHKIKECDFIFVKIVRTKCLFKLKLLNVKFNINNFIFVNF